MNTTKKHDIILSDITSNSQALSLAKSLVSYQLKEETQLSDREMLETISEIAQYTLEKCM